MRLRLYLISQEENRGYDTYDSAVVAAKNEHDAKRIHPSGRTISEDSYGYGGWVNDPEKVSAKLIGVADSSVSAGVICASFNAG